MRYDFVVCLPSAVTTRERGRRGGTPNPSRTNLKSSPPPSNLTEDQLQQTADEVAREKRSRGEGRGERGEERQDNEQNRTTSREREALRFLLAEARI